MRAIAAAKLRAGFAVAAAQAARVLIHFW